MKLRLFLSLSLLCSPLLLGACASNNTETTATYSFIKLSPTAPPELPYQPKIVAADPEREIWRPGYWAYNGLTFYWVEGSFIARPDPTAAWSPERWEKRNYGWAFVGGYWQ